MSILIKAVDCGEPPVLENMAATHSNTTHGHQAYYNCTEGYWTADLLTSTCTQDEIDPHIGIWTPIDTTCQCMHTILLLILGI